jgi:PIN domain nuclease of toxin-antitoxin system
MLNLDTNVLLSALLDRLRPRERALLESGEEWAISAIVLWEIEKLFSLGRIQVMVDDAAMTDALRRLRVLPLTPEVAMGLRRLDFRSDPADEIIAATSIVHGAPLLTRDATLLASKVVPLALRD